MAMKKVNRKTLASYASILGKNSIAAHDLIEFDGRKARGEKPIILMGNNGFRIVLPEKETK